VTADGPVGGGYCVLGRVWLLAAISFEISTLSVVEGALILRIVSTRSGRWSVTQWFGLKKPSFWGNYIERRKIR